LRKALAPSGKSLVEVSVACVLGRPGITSAIGGATKPEQLTASLAATTIVLTDEIRSVCDELWFDLPRRRASR
jgi:1-deoxyxylulose-5-phosphate synthase